MKRLLFLFVLAGFVPAVYGQLFLNSSFENTIVTNCMINNISNTQFDSLMSNAKGIGATETIDIFYDSSCPQYGSAQEGHYFVSVENNSNDSTQSTAISLKLSDTLQTGNSYSFCFYDKSQLIGAGPVVIGISNTDSTFGTVIYTAPTADTVWTLRTVTFNAPFTVRYVTVKYGSFNGGAFIDNFGECSGTGFDGQANIENLKIFPNPFSNQITFATSTYEETTIYLYDYLGQHILQQTFSNSATINTGQLANGIYFYELKNSMRTITNGKVVKN